MKPSNAKPHAGRRGASDHASAQESVCVSDHTVPQLSVVPHNATGELSGEKPALIPPGTYRVRLVDWQTAILWGRSHKLALHFRVCDLGPHFGAKVVRWYNVERIKGRPSVRGKFKVGWKREVVRDYCTLVPDLKRLDRLHLERLESLLIVARVETVTSHSRQRTIHEPLQYSVVHELLGVEAGLTSNTA